MTRPSFLDIATFDILKNKYQNEIELEKVIKKIEDGYPVQYIIGNVPFLNTTIKCDGRALIPRNETEILVDKVIKLINNDKPNIVDLCTGSGCISIALKKNIQDAKITAVDISEDALELAKENATFNRVNINFIEKDVLKDYNYDEKFDILISNPPYVKEDEYVSKNTKYEPNIALYPGGDSTIFYKRILDYSNIILNKQNIIAFEINTADSTELLNYSKEKYPSGKVYIEKDYAGFDRYLFIINE